MSFYWYRSRGGPLLMKFTGENMAAALNAEAASAAELAEAYASNRRPAAVVATIREIVVRYKEAPDGFLKLADSTRTNWKPWLDEIIREFGDLPATALKAKGVRREFIAWRDRRSATPRSADYGLQVLKRVLSWAVEREDADINPAIGIKNLYRAGRADRIVEPQELTAILAQASPDAATAIRLAAATGLRRSDLVRVKWSDVSEYSIELATGKSRGRLRVIVPLVADARELLADLRRQRDASDKPSLFLLTSERGGPWSKDSVTQAFIRAAHKAGVENRTLHDLRGTAATRFILAGLSDEQVAEILGWEPAQVTRIRKRYVDRDRIAQGIIAQLERAEKDG